jgi:ABC-type enterobactin transport system permease subunit
MSLTQSQKIAISTYMSEVLLPDSLEEVLLVQSGQSEFGNVIAALVGSASGLPALAKIIVLGVRLPVALVAVSAAATIGSYVNQQNVNQIRKQVTNAFWLTIK